MSAVELTNVTKRYGALVALDDLSLRIPKGAVCGLIGPNGSGKTTTMALIAGLLRPESGTVHVLGAGPFVAETHAGRVSLMPQDSSPSPHVSIERSLRYYAELQGLSAQEARDESNKWLSRVELETRAASKFGQLSHGMRRRFSIAQAMLGKPELILLDEPTSGLDPELVVKMRDLFLEQRGKATLVLSSHVLSELETTCDYAVFMERGRCVRQGSMAEITGTDSIVRITLTRAPNLDQLGALLPACTLKWQEPHLVVQAPRSQPVEETNGACLRALLEQNIGILQLAAGQSLEATYLQVRDKNG